MPVDAGLCLSAGYSGAVGIQETERVENMDVPFHLVADPRLSNGTVRVLMVLYGMCKWASAHDPFVYPSIERIGQMAGGMSRSTVGRALRQAREVGAIERDHKHGHEGFRLTPHPQAKGTIPPEAAGEVGQNWHRSGSEVTQDQVRNDLPPSGPVSAPVSDQVKTDTPYNIGIKLKDDPPVPPRGDDVADIGPDNDDERAESPTHAQCELVVAPPPKPRAKPGPKPRAKKSRAQTKAEQRADIERVFEALCEARAMIAERTGEKLTTIRLISREDFIKQAIGRHGLDQVLQSLRNQGELGSAKALSILTNTATPFRSPNVKRALDRDELQRLAEFDCPASGRVVRRVMDVKGVQTL